jgi:hypothetical protein
MVTVLYLKMVRNSDSVMPLMEKKLSDEKDKVKMDL